MAKPLNVPSSIQSHLPIKRCMLSFNHWCFKKNYKMMPLYISQMGVGGWVGEMSFGNPLEPNLNPRHEF